MDHEVRIKAVSKTIAHDGRNVKNVLRSLATKHQQLMAYHLDGQNLSLTCTSGIFGQCAENCCVKEITTY